MSFATRPATLRASLSIAAAMGLSLGVALSSAQAQAPAKPAAPARPAPTAPAQNQGGAPEATPGALTVVQVKGAAEAPEWSKQCGNDEAANAEVCVTAREFVSEQNQPVLAVAMYEIKKEKNVDRRVRFLLPFGLALDTGVRFSVDRSGFVPGKFQVCMPNGCFAEVPVKEDVMKTMKTGKTFNVTVRNSAGAEVVFAVPTEGFTKAFDGPAIDPKAIAERQKQMEQDLQKKSEQLRRDLESRGSAGVPPPAPAPAPAAAPKQ